MAENFVGGKSRFVQTQIHLQSRLLFDFLWYLSIQTLELIYFHLNKLSLSNTEQREDIVLHLVLLLALCCSVLNRGLPVPCLSSLVSYQSQHTADL